MNSYELCSDCRPYGKCLFEKKALNIAQNVPPIDQQTPIGPNEKTRREAFDAHVKIADLREEARKLNCPKVNSVNPDYPGKNNL